MIEPKQWIEALERIARTEDGWLLFCGLHKVAISLPEPGAKSGALRDHHGRRTLAREIMDLMSEGIDERGRRTGTSGTDKLSEQPVAFARPKPVAVSRGHGTGRRIAPSDGSDGWPATEPEGAA